MSLYCAHRVKRLFWRLKSVHRPQKSRARQAAVCSEVCALHRADNRQPYSIKHVTCDDYQVCPRG